MKRHNLIYSGMLLLLVFFVIIFLLLANTCKAAMVVTDPTSYGYYVEQVKQLTEQVKKAAEQVETLKSMYETSTETLNQLK